LTQVRKHFIIPDIQIPHHNRDIVYDIIEIGVKENPDTITIIGDFLDCPSVSTFSKGTAAEYASTLVDDIRVGREIIEDIRTAFSDKKIYFHMGNHENRLQSYIRKNAPALVGLPSLYIPVLLGFGENDITLADPYQIHDDSFVTTHGHLGSLSRHAGMTALLAAEKIGMPVVCGHTHRLGLMYSSHGMSDLGTRKTLWGMEVGHAMDTSKADYKKDGVFNWQAGLGFVVCCDGKTKPVVISME
jgi:predicted phosphodiesterase